MNSARWSWLLLLLACSDDAASPGTPHSDAGRDAASNAPAPDAAFDAARDAGARDAAVDGGAKRSCDDLVCGDSHVCQYGCAQGGLDCEERIPLCMRVVDRCAECGTFEECREPLCVKGPSPCPTVCDYRRPVCEPACAADYTCGYDGASCDDAGVCTPISICERSVLGCAECRADELCREFVLVDLSPITVCVPR